jgi:putative monooxygenase
MSEVSKVKVSAADMPPSHRQGGSVRALLTPKSVGAVSGFLGTIELAPGEFLSEHLHPYSDKFVFLVSGSAVVYLEGNPVPMCPDDAILINRGTRHRIENTGGQPVRAVFSISPLAPRAELGHVDIDPVPNPHALPPKVGGPA